MAQQIKFNERLITTKDANTGFVYEVKITAGCELLKAEPLKSSLENFGELTIISEWFSDHVECVDDVAVMLQQFSGLISALTGRGHIIATKMNPMHNEDFDGEMELLEDWDGGTIMKMYVADTKVLKSESRIVSYVTGIVRTADNIDLDLAVAPPSMQ